MYRSGTPKPGKGWVALKHISKLLCASCLKFERGEVTRPQAKFNLDEGWQDCTRCNRRLALNMFYAVENVPTKSGYRAECKLCNSLRTYGLTAQQYLEKLDAQGGGCAICSKTPDENKQRLSVDHNHKCCTHYTEACGACNRGLLCAICNWLIGAYGDSPAEIARFMGTEGWGAKAVTYLRHWGLT